MSCQKAQGFLGQTKIAVAETVDARKERFEGADALALLEGIDQLVVARGRKLTVIDLKNDRPTDDVLLAHLLGPSGNLRAPTARTGRTLVVGFSEEAYRQLVGASESSSRAGEGV
jgi:arsenate reductase-like glutaredoxin family protein